MKDRGRKAESTKPALVGAVSLCRRQHLGEHTQYSGAISKAVHRADSSNKPSQLRKTAQDDLHACAFLFASDFYLTAQLSDQNLASPQNGKVQVILTEELRSPEVSFLITHSLVNEYYDLIHQYLRDGLMPSEYMGADAILPQEGQDHPSQAGLRCCRLAWQAELNEKLPGKGLLNILHPQVILSYLMIQYLIVASLKLQILHTLVCSTEIHTEGVYNPQRGVMEHMRKVLVRVWGP